MDFQRTTDRLNYFFFQPSWTLLVDYKYQKQNSEKTEFELDGLDSVVILKTKLTESAMKFF